MSQEERFGSRDRTYSAWHRRHSTRRYIGIDGPALGLWQMERATHDDIWTHFLNGRTKLGLNVLGPYYKPDVTRMVWDLSYACAMCRIHYLRCSDALPPAGDIAGQAAYWKRWYNTPLGKGTVEQYIDSWRVAMGDTP